MAGRSGSAIIAILVLFVVITGVVWAFVGASMQNAFATRRAIDVKKARMVAEAGLEYAELRLREYIFEYALGLPLQGQMQTLVDSITPPYSPDYNYCYITPTGGVAFRITVENHVQYDNIITNGTACRGLRGDAQFYTVDVGAYNPSTGAGAVLRMRLQAVGVFLIRYALFYQEDLEIWPGPVMNVTGPTHGNADLYLGCNNSLTFWDRVVASGNMYNRRKYPSADTGSHVRIVDGGGTPQSINQGGYRLDSTWHDWVHESLDRWDGNMMTHEHGIQQLRPPVAADSQTNLHDLIKRSIPVGDPKYSAATEEEKFANKSSLVIHITSNNQITAHTRVWASETNLVITDVSTNFTLALIATNPASPGRYTKQGGQYVVTNGGTIGLTITNFFDAREDTYMAPVDIYMDAFIPIITNTARPGFNFTTNDFAGLVYVTRDTPTNQAGATPAVRLRNGANLASDISIVSDLPLYVEGNFNTNNPVPALVAGDAVTLLSGEWQDVLSRQTLNNRLKPNNTDFNTVIMTGNVPTEGGNYSGGVENVLRFLEHWGSRTTTYRGSIICLWRSEMATGRWRYGNPVYEAPNRDWGYDNMYRTQCPPGMTRVFGMEELEWGYANWSVFH